MQVTADLQLHSKYARAVSPKMIPGEIAVWAKKKGIGLLASGDWTHPLWLKQLQSNLEEVAPGLFMLKGTGPATPHPRATSSSVFVGLAGGPRGTPTPRHPFPLFLLSTEVSSIYTQGGKQRRIHTLIFAPSFEVVEKINREFLRRGANLMSDGRPIIGLSAREVAQLVLEIAETCLIIPAHAWTPWFSLYGSESGFDSIEECFGELAKYIYAIETGLSSDPAMNWRIGELEGRSIVSFSDAHSPQKLGREATVFELPELSYEGVRKAIVAGPKASNPSYIAYTIEFYPEEGKYHYTGHSRCGVKQSPQETQKLGVTCSVCGRRLTVGVMARVEQLSNRAVERLSETDEYGVRWIKHPENKKPPYVMLVPLLEILAEGLNSTISSQKTISEYEKLTQFLGPEFEILLQTKPEDIEKFSGPRVREAIEKVRRGDIFIDPGFDGVFGTVKIWQEKEEASQEVKEQMNLFGEVK